MEEDVNRFRRFHLMKSVNHKGQFINSSIDAIRPKRIFFKLDPSAFVTL